MTVLETIVVTVLYCCWADSGKIKVSQQNPVQNVMAHPVDRLLNFSNYKDKSSFNMEATENAFPYKLGLL